MKLFTKGERRYTEATDAEILDSASEVLKRHGVEGHSTLLNGMATLMRGIESRYDKSRIISIERLKSEMLPGAEPIKPPRRGGEPS